MNIIKAIPNRTIKDRYTFFKGTTYEFHTFNNSKYIFYNGRSTKFTDLSDFTITSITKDVFPMVRMNITCVI